MTQTNIRRRRPTVYIFEDGKTPPLRQATFPSRRHRSTGKTPASTTPAARWRQQTLTQITPSLSHSFSSHDSSVEAHDLEYDSLPTIMPPKKRSRKSSKRTSDQQTITQMDPFKIQLRPEDGLANSADEYSPRSETPPLKKKRKTSLGTPVAPTVRTRSAKKKAAEINVKDEHEDEAYAQESKEATSGPDVTPSVTPGQGMRMPPPKTPKTARRTEIPSSQSPAETPISSRTRRDTNDSVLTPLKERSMNTSPRHRLFSRRKSAHLAPRLEVADSTDFEDENNEIFFPLIPRGGGVEDKLEPVPSPQLQSSPKRSNPITTSTKPLSDVASLPPTPSLSSQTPRTIRRKAAIADSFDETISSGRSSPEKSDHDPEPHLFQATLSTTATDSVNQNNSLVGEDKRLAQSADSSNLEVREIKFFETVPTQMLPQQSKLPSPASPPGATLRQPQPQRHLSDSERVSAQLNTELLHSSSPASVPPAPALETESQFENAWREYTPPQLAYEYFESDKHQVPEVLQPIQPTLPTPVRTGSSTGSIPLPPIPPSQATTADITQSSPHRPPLQSDLHTSPPHFTSSSPIEHFQPPSSPFQERKESAAGDTYMGYEGWNGVQMTDSQLLPASLLNDSLEAPVRLEGNEDFLIEEMNL